MSVTTGTGAKKTSGSDNWRTIIGAHNDTVDVYDKVKAAAAIFASAYDSTATYAAGDQCTHDGKWYVANQAISTAEDWTAAHWTEITIASKLDTANVYNGLDKTASGFALDARQGKSLNEAIANTQSGLAIVANGNTHPAIGAGQFVYVKNHSTLADGLYTNKSGNTIAANDTLTSSNLQAESSGGFNSLNSKINSVAMWTKFSDLTLSNCEAHSDVGAKYAKYLGFVVLQIYVKSLTANSRTKIATLPTGYRPLKAFSYVGQGGASYTSKAYFNVSDTGDIYVISEDTYAQGYIIFWAA